MRETCTSGLSRNLGEAGVAEGKGTPNWCLNSWSRANNSEMISIPRVLSSSRGSKSESEVTQSCPILCDPMDCSLWGSSIHGIFQARVLEWVAVPFSRGSSQLRDWTRGSSIASRWFYFLSHQGSYVINSITQKNDCVIISYRKLCDK